MDKDVDLENFFKNNFHHFKYFGGDIDIFIQNIKYAYSRRTICNISKKYKIIKSVDLETGLKKFLDTRKDEDKKINDKKKFYDTISKLLK